MSDGEQKGDKVTTFWGLIGSLTTKETIESWIAVLLNIAVILALLTKIKQLDSHCLNPSPSIPIWGEHSANKFCKLLVSISGLPRSPSASGYLERLVWRWQSQPGNYLHKFLRIIVDKSRSMLHLARHGAICSGRTTVSQHIRMSQRTITYKFQSKRCMQIYIWPWLVFLTAAPFVYMLCCHVISSDNSNFDRPSHN